MAARDRLAAMRAQRQGQQGFSNPSTPQQSTFEMTGVPQQQPSPQPQPYAPTNGYTNGGRATGVDGMSEFYAEIQSIQEMIRQFDANVSRISEMHSRSLNTLDDSSQQNHAVLDELVAETRSLSNQLRNRIQTLAKQPVAPGQDARIRQNQTQLVRTRFMDALQNYQTVEKDYRARYKQRVERQFKIVKPDATPDEVAAVVNDEGGGSQLFSQALMSSTRYGESRAAYREVQERHEDIRKIENTLAELAQMFNELNDLVLQQDDTINAIEDSAGRVENDTAQGLVQTEKAVKSARAARRKRWICFGIFVLVLAVIAIVLGIIFGTKKN